MAIKHVTIIFVTAAFVAAFVQVALTSLALLLTMLIILCVVIMTTQAIFTITGMLYAWANANRSTIIPLQRYAPKHSFTALVPAKNEDQVIAQTIFAIDQIDYPKEKKQLIVICQAGDSQTIAKAQQAIALLDNPRYQVVTFQNGPINKPHALNVGLQYATNDIVVVFDAEDQPSTTIYHAANSAFLQRYTDVLQCGVQLMNFKSSWYATLNVLEYYTWFKSVLHYLSLFSLVPLAGNTVFFRRSIIEQVGGWDEACLTEDCDIGITLASRSAAISVTYDAALATQEETPASIASFIRQRTRWNQGFLQVLRKGEWRNLPAARQRLAAVFILLWPTMQSMFTLYTIFSLVALFAIKLPVGIALIANIPLYLLIIELCILNLALYEFTQEFQLAYSWYLPVKVVATFLPMLILLTVSALRAYYRLASNNAGWEKTQHTNAHRTFSAFGLYQLRGAGI